jgi:hypothetical protein
LCPAHLQTGLFGYTFQGRIGSKKRQRQWAEWFLATQDARFPSGLYWGRESRKANVGNGALYGEAWSRKDAARKRRAEKQQPVGGEAEDIAAHKAAVKRLKVTNEWPPDATSAGGAPARSHAIEEKAALPGEAKENSAMGENTLGYWIDPEGCEIEVHSSPPYTHAGKALQILGGVCEDDPVLSLLRRGWIRVSIDTVSVHGLDDRKRRRIGAFSRAHASAYEAMGVVFVEDEKSGKSRRTTAEKLAAW